MSHHVLSGDVFEKWVRAKIAPTACSDRTDSASNRQATRSATSFPLFIIIHVLLVNYFYTSHNLFFMTHIRLSLQYDHNQKSLYRTQSVCLLISSTQSLSGIIVIVFFLHCYCNFMCLEGYSSFCQGCHKLSYSVGEDHATDLSILSGSWMYPKTMGAILFQNISWWASLL